MSTEPWSQRREKLRILRYPVDIRHTKTHFSYSTPNCNTRLRKSSFFLPFVKYSAEYFAVSIFLRIFATD